MGKKTFNALVAHPSVGSVWLHHVRLEDGMVTGAAYDSGMAGSSLYPDDYSGEWVSMRFPARCIRKVDMFYAPEVG